MKTWYSRFLTFLAVGVFASSVLVHAQLPVLYELDYHGEKARSWSLPSTADGSAGIEQFPNPDLDFITQMAVRFNRPVDGSGLKFQYLNLFLDGILSEGRDTTMSYSGEQAAFAWPIPFNHIPQTFIKKATRFTAPENALLSNIDIFAWNGVSSTDGFNDTLLVTLYEPFEPETVTVSYGLENPQNNAFWQFNFPVGTARDAYGTRFTAPAAARVNTIQFYVDDMNHNTFLPPGDPQPNDNLVVRLWRVNAENLPGEQIAITRVNMADLTIKSWNQVSFFDANIVTEIATEIIATFELEAIGLQDHIGFSSGAQFEPPVGRSIIRENGVWKTIATSTAFSGGNARGAELWTRATFIPAGQTVNDPLTPDETRPIGEPVKIVMSQIQASAYNRFDFSAQGIEMQRGRDFWAVVELIHVGTPDLFEFISDGVEREAKFRSAAYVSDAAGGARWLFMQNTQFGSEYIMRKAVTYSVQGDVQVRDDIFVVLYDDNNGKPGNFVNLTTVPLTSLEIGAFNPIDVTAWGDLPEVFHVGVTSAFENNQFSLATDDGSNALEENRTSVFLSKSEEWIAISQLEGVAEVNLLMGVVMMGGVSVITPEALPERFALTGNYPNPFNPVTTITFQMADPAQVRLAVYDLLGREVAVLIDAPMPVGNHSAMFDGRGLGSGIYLVRMQAEGTLLTSKMMLVK
jgi:hypothetical protein